MNKNPTTSQRKSDHIRIVLKEKVKSGLTNGFERFHFYHQALPEIDLSEIETGISVFNRSLRAPLLISSMTGGTSEAGKINRCLAEVAQMAGIAMGVGSQRVGLEDSRKMQSFKVRQIAPDILLFANLGAVQLNYSYTIEHCQRAVDAIEADALFLHLNPLQEALQPEGNTDFSGLLKKIEMVCREIKVPVVVKEVGWGISERTARQLATTGIAAIDVAGAGGTSWSEVERHRLKDPVRIRVASGFINWGIPTADSILQVKKAAPDLKIFASGGITNGIEVAKAIAMGATLAGMANSFIQTASFSKIETKNLLAEIILQLRICMFVAGAENINALMQTPLIQEYSNVA